MKLYLWDIPPRCFWRVEMTEAHGVWRKGGTRGAVESKCLSGCPAGDGVFSVWDEEGRPLIRHSFFSLSDSDEYDYTIHCKPTQTTIDKMDSIIHMTDIILEAR